MAKMYVCERCGYVGKPKRATKGNIWLEIGLWCCYILPGVLYSLWRQTTKYNVCKKCKSADLLPLDTPRGQEMLQHWDNSRNDAAVYNTNR